MTGNQVKAKVKAWRKDKASWETIVNEISRSGFLSKKTGKPYSRTGLCQFVYGRSRSAVKKAKVKAKVKGTLEVEIRAVLRLTHLSSGKKLEAIAQMVRS